VLAAGTLELRPGDGTADLAATAARVTAACGTAGGLAGGTEVAVLVLVPQAERAATAIMADAAAVTAFMQRSNIRLLLSWPSGTGHKARPVCFLAYRRGFS